MLKKILNLLPIPCYDTLKSVYNGLNPVYMPHYNRNTPLSNFVPEIYNKSGKMMEIFFINDVCFAHTPYGLSQNFLWDRYNFGLNTHFYTHRAMLHTRGKPTRRFGWLLESEAIAPYDYQLFNKHRGLEKDFDFIFTYSEKILEAIPNARFAPAGGVTYGTTLDGGILNEKAETEKIKDISIVASNNSATQLHKLRQDFARKIKRMHIGDTFGTFDGGKRFKNIADSLTNYRYSIIIENDLKPYYFTEKILNCFAAMTIPIYLGAEKINHFFNMDGIITITENDIHKLDEIIKQCTAEFYSDHITAIRDNFQRIKNFMTIEDYMYDNFLRENL